MSGVKVWARYAVRVMVLVDEESDEIEKVVLVAGERDIDRARPSMEMLFYTEELGLISDSRDEAAHALSVGDHARWPDMCDWEIEQSWDGLRMAVDELRHPGCPDCGGAGYSWPADDPRRGRRSLPALRRQRDHRAGSRPSLGSRGPARVASRDELTAHRRM